MHLGAAWFGIHQGGPRNDGVEVVGPDKLALEERDACTDLWPSACCLGGFHKRGRIIASIGMTFQRLSLQVYETLVYSAAEQRHARRRANQTRR